MTEAAPGARLSVSITDGMTVEVRLGLREIRIGRSREADLQLPDPSISRMHARVYRVGHRYFLADLGSRNGTRANGKPVTQLPLDDGQVFQVGPYRIHFLRSDALPPSGEEPTAVLGSGDPVAAETRQRRPPAAPPDPKGDGGAPFGMVGNSPPLRKLTETVRRVGDSDAAVLIEGETGCGKELVARGLHEVSGRRDRPFVVVNCGAISPDLIESELFGHEKGSFTGATAQRRGAFELAHNGTIFLDEIGELTYSLQPKLLRALEQKEVKRVGGNDTLFADVRIIAATNRNLRDEIARRTFREDLYFRVGAISISVPPLRDRREDIAATARFFLAGMGGPSANPPPALSPAALDVLLAHDWPGNVRELRNAIQRAVVMAEGPELGAPDFAFLRLAATTNAAVPDVEGLSRWEQAERANIVAELARQSGNKTRTARSLGIAKSTLFEKLKRYEIRPPETDG